MSALVPYLALVVEKRPARPDFKVRLKGRGTAWTARLSELRLRLAEVISPFPMGCR